MKVVYIAGPYRSKTVNGIVKNIMNAEQYALKYWQKGYAVICPHKNTALMDGLLPDSSWLDGDIELLSRSDIIVMIPGWNESNGSKKEHEMARMLYKEIIYED